jgi:uncharacterized protein YbjT (DUF2867 family)
MIILTGATGTIGSHLVRELRAAGASFKALARSGETAARLEAQGVAVVRGDLDAPAGLESSFAGARSLFLLAAGGPALARQEIQAIEAARAAGVARIVLLSGIGASPDSPSAFQRLHGQSDAHLRASGLAWTVLRPNGFMQNFPAFYGAAVAGGSPIFAPMGEAKVSYIDAADVASAAAAVLTQEGHERRIYELTGPEALSYGELARTLSDLTGRQVTYVPVSDAAAHQAMSGFGPWMAHAVLGLNQEYRRGLGELVTGSVEILTGRPARTLEAYLRANLAAFTA